MSSTGPLTLEVVEHVLRTLPKLNIGIVGDLFLDRYLDLDATLTEPSLETGLDAYQVVRVRAQPGAAGTVLNNLVALGVGRVVPLAVVGDDGEGYELRQALARMASVDTSYVISNGGRRTPTYTKPMLQEPNQLARELNRLDIKNRQPLPPQLEARLLDDITRLAAQVNGFVILDQVSEEDCGVITKRVRQRLADLKATSTALPILADSRERIGLFKNVMLKPNRRECLHALGLPASDAAATNDAIVELARRAGRPVFCTAGEEGILLAEPNQNRLERVPAYPVTGPIDVVGAGDSTSAGILCALAAGTTNAQAAAFGNLVASITIKQLGTTGTATPQQLRQRWQEVVKTAG